jgi:hypothetical protein
MKRKVAYLRQFLGEDQFCRRSALLTLVMKQWKNPWPQRRGENPSYDDKVLFLQNIYLKNIAVGSVLYYKLIQKGLERRH